MLESTLVKFKGSQLVSTLSPECRKLLNQQHILIQGQSQYQALLQLLQISQEWCCQQLLLGNGPFDKILKQMETIEWSKLRKLYLIRIKLESAELLGRMHAENLTQIDMYRSVYFSSQNQVLEIRGVRKGYFPQLRRVLLFKNKFQCLWPLTELLCPNMTDLETEQFGHHSVEDQDLRYLLKMNIKPENLNALFIKGNRIIVKNVTKKLEVKYKLLTIRDKNAPNNFHLGH